MEILVGVQFNSNLQVRLNAGSISRNFPPSHKSVDLISLCKNTNERICCLYRSHRWKEFHGITAKVQMFQRTKEIAKSLLYSIPTIEEKGKTHNLEHNESARRDSQCTKISLRSIRKFDCVLRRENHVAPLPPDVSSLRTRVDSPFTQEV